LSISKLVVKLLSARDYLFSLLSIAGNVNGVMKVRPYSISLSKVTFLHVVSYFGLLLIPFIDFVGYLRNS